MLKSHYIDDHAHYELHRRNSFATVACRLWEGLLVNFLVDESKLVKDSALVTCPRCLAALAKVTERMTGGVSESAAWHEMRKAGSG